MAKLAPAPGTTLEEVTRTRAIPDASAERSDDRDFWEFTAALTTKDWERYLIYVYRMTGDRLGPYVAKYPSRISEDMIAENHGGGKYRCWLKTTAGEIIKTANFEIEGAPKINTGAPTANPAAPMPQHAADQSSLNRLCDLLERVVLRNDNGAIQGEALRSALNLQSEGFRSVVQNVRDIAPPAAAPAAAATNPLLDKLLEAAIAKLLNPSDPIETFAKMMTAMKGLGFDGGASKSSIGAELVRTVGGAIPQIVDGVKSYTTAVTKQAELEMMRIASGQGRPAQPQPPAPQPTAAQPSMPQATIPPQQAPTQPPPMSLEEVETKILSMLTDGKISIQQAANDVLDFIEDISPTNLYPYICSMDEPNLAAFINSRPILSQAVTGPRFREIVKRIVELTHSDAGSAPQNTAPQVPAAS